MVGNPVFLRSTNLEIHSDILNLLANSQSENFQLFTVCIHGDLPSFLSALVSNNVYNYRSAINICGIYASHY